MNKIDIALKTRRLILRTIDETYADKILNYLEKNKIFLGKWEDHLHMVLLNEQVE